MTLLLFLVAFTAFVFLGINLLPNAPADPSGFVTSFGYIFGVLRSFDWILPVNDIFICLGIVITTVIATAVFQVMIFTIKIVRGGTS